MPVIRIAEIPNAGPRAVAASSANMGVPQFGGFSVNPQAAQLDGSAALSDTSIRRGAQSMLSQTLEANAFTAEAEAGMKLGYAVGQFGQVAGQLGEKFAKAKDTADLARAETTMRAAFEKQQSEQLDLPVDQWEENWTRNLDLTRKALAEIKVSNNAAAELSPSWDRWSQLSQLQIKTLSRKKQIEGFQMDVEANAMMRLAGDDIAGAISQYDRGVENGIFTPEEGNMRKARLANDQTRQAQSQNQDRLVGWMNSDPNSLRPLLEDRAKGNDVPELGDLTTVQATALLNTTDRVILESQADDDDAADQAVLTGEIKNEEDLRKQFPNLSERRILGHVATLTKVYDGSPRRWEEIQAARPKLLSAIDTYEATQDNESWDKYFALKDAIKAQLPEGERQEFLTSLSAKRRGEKKALPQPIKDTLDNLSTLVDKGYLGVVDRKQLESNNPKTRNAEANKLLEVSLRHDNVRRQLLQWAERNPAKADDPVQVQTFLRTTLNPQSVEAAINLMREQVQQREVEKAATDAVNFGMDEYLPAITPAGPQSSRR